MTIERIKEIKKEIKRHRNKAWEKMLNIDETATKEEYIAVTLSDIVIITLIIATWYIVAIVGMALAETVKNIYILCLLGVVLSLDLLAILAIIWILVCYFIKFITLTVRRLNAINKSTFWLLITFIPIIGWAVLVTMLITSKDRCIGIKT